MKKVALVCMPWYDLSFPAIQCEILKESLEHKGIGSDIIHGYLLWGEYLLDKYKEDEYKMLGTMRDICFKYGYLGLGEWIFSEAINPQGNENEYFEYVQQNFNIIGMISGENVEFSQLRENVQKMKKLSTRFIEMIGDQIINSGYNIVGFSSTFNQNLASLSLAKYLKNKKSEIKVIFGGANCDSIQGKQLVESYEFIDFVLSGEGEISLPMLVESITNDTLNYNVIPGLYYREKKEVLEGSFEKLSDLDTVPIPSYDSYFKMLRNLRLEDYISPQILLETSRGCWWGEYSQCKFCGLNKKRICFRYRKNFSLKNTIMNYLDKHPSCANFILVDNIIPNNYYNKTLDELSELDYDFSLFYEIRSNLNDERARKLSDANIKMVQPGIENLETKILKLMGKGLRAIENIQTLKMAEKYNLIVQWNILLGFIGEEQKDYSIDKYRDLAHLYPPVSAGRIFLERYSPYFESNKMEIKGNKEYYNFLYALNKFEVENIAYIFNYKEEGVHNQFIDEMKKFCQNWASNYPCSVLYFEETKEGMYIFDTREGDARNYFYSEYWQCRIIEFIDEYKDFSTIEKYAKAKYFVGKEDLELFLQDLVSKKLCYVEGDDYISLIIPFKRKYQKIYQRLVVASGEYTI